MFTVYKKYQKVMTEESQTTELAYYCHDISLVERQYRRHQKQQQENLVMEMLKPLLYCAVLYLQFLQEDV